MFCETLPWCMVELSVIFNCQLEYCVDVEGSTIVEKLNVKMWCLQLFVFTVCWVGMLPSLQVRGLSYTAFPALLSRRMTSEEWGNCGLLYSYHDWNSCQGWAYASVWPKIGLTTECTKHLVPRLLTPASEGADHAFQGEYCSSTGNGCRPYCNSWRRHFQDFSALVPRTA